MVSQAKGGCKLCGLKTHTAFKCPKKPIKAQINPLKVNKVKLPTKKRNPTKKASKSVLKKKLEILVKDYVKRRDNYTCHKCGKSLEGSNCHASHVIPVSRSGYLQFEPLNMKVLCYHCHINWWHKHPIEAGKWFTDTFPERWEYLENLHKQRLKPMNEAQLLEKIEEYTLKIGQNA